MRLFRAALEVGDLEEAKHFYRALFGTPPRGVGGGRLYLDCGGTILACFDAKADGDSVVPGPNPEHVYFAVSDLEAAYDRAVAAGCQWIEGTIQSRAWGERSFYARDPFGNPICLVDEKTIFTG